MNGQRKSSYSGEMVGGSEVEQEVKKDSLSWNFRFSIFLSLHALFWVVYSDLSSSPLYIHAKSLQSCLTLCDPMYWRPGSL